MQEKMVARRCPTAADKRRNQPPDSDQLKRLWENLPQAEGWEQQQGSQQR
jgi:hypothetical protein